jgi:aspartokinase
LAEAGINVQMINTSEIRMSSVIAASGGRTAHATLLKAFQLERPESAGE